MLRALVRAQAEVRPTVLLLDDLHWIDEGSERLLQHVVEAAAGTRTLVLANFRPEHAPTWLRGVHVETVTLAPLDRGRVELMLCARIGDANVALELAARVCDQVGGNPFFVEEFVESLAEQGTLQGERGRLMLAGSLAAITVPATVESVIAARIDRLPEASKQVLQIASVVGGTFGASILQELTDQSGDEVSVALGVLCHSDFLCGGSADGEYMFKHPVTKRVAYDSQLRSRRAVVHARVAAVLAAGRGADERDAALIAHHFELAERRADAARWNIKAAEVAGGWDSAQTMRACEHRSRGASRGARERNPRAPGPGNCGAGQVQRGAAARTSR